MDQCQVNDMFASPVVSGRLGVVQIDLSKALNAWCRPEQGGDIYRSRVFQATFNLQDYIL